MPAQRGYEREAGKTEEPSSVSLTRVYVGVHQLAYLSVLAGRERTASASSKQLHLFQVQVAVTRRV